LQLQKMRKILPAIAVLLTVVLLQRHYTADETPAHENSAYENSAYENSLSPAGRSTASLERSGDGILAAAGDERSAIGQAYLARRSSVQVEDGGTVVRVLADDNDGSRHQRFIVELNSGQTVLIAHNIDIAPRIADLRNGDRVRFNGEYEWNDRGGIIHWTHLDPAGRHADGWLEHEGKRYQ
jgi:Protein of unknown function (DUF3465)